MRLHAIVAIIGSDLKEFRQIPMPAVKVNRDGPLTHAQLINRYRGIIDQPDPAQHTARGALKAPDITAGIADLAEVQAHAAALFGDLRKAVERLVNSLQRIRNDVDKA